jgi:hypothetical protein
LEWLKSPVEATMNENFPLYIPILSSALTGAVALLGVLLSNGSTYRRLKLENQISEHRNRLEIKRARGEELYGLIHNWINIIGSRYLSLMRVMKEEYSYNDHLGLELKRHEKIKFDFGRIEMLIDVYFPEVRKFYDDAVESRTKINKIATEHEMEYKKGYTDGRRFIPNFIEAQVEFEANG